MPLEWVMNVGRLPSGGDVKAPAEGSGPTSITRPSEAALAGCNWQLAPGF